MADLNRLKPGDELNDSMIDFYLDHLLKKQCDAETRRRVHIFSTHFYTQLTMTAKASAGIDFTRVAKWTKGVDLLTKDLVFIPIHRQHHWSLVIVVRPGDAAPPGDDVDSVGPIPEDGGGCAAAEGYYRCESERREDERDMGRAVPAVLNARSLPPCILYLDSLMHNQNTACDRVRGYLNELWRASRHGQDPTKTEAAEGDVDVEDGGTQDPGRGAHHGASQGYERETFTKDTTATATPGRPPVRYDKANLIGVGLGSLPEQLNSTDCGLFTLLYTQHFLSFTTPRPPALPEWGGHVRAVREKYERERVRYEEGSMEWTTRRGAGGATATATGGEGSKLTAPRVLKGKHKKPTPPHPRPTIHAERLRFNSALRSKITRLDGWPVWFDSATEPHWLRAAFASLVAQFAPDAAERVAALRGHEDDSDSELEFEVIKPADPAMARKAAKAKIREEGEDVTDAEFIPGNVKAKAKAKGKGVDRKRKRGNGLPVPGPAPTPSSPVLGRVGSRHASPCKAREATLHMTVGGVGSAVPIHRNIQTPYTKPSEGPMITSAPEIKPKPRQVIRQKTALGLIPEDIDVREGEVKTRTAGEFDMSAFVKVPGDEAITQRRHNARSKKLQGQKAPLGHPQAVGETDGLSPAIDLTPMSLVDDVEDGDESTQSMASVETQRESPTPTPPPKLSTRSARARQGDGASFGQPTHTKPFTTPPPPPSSKMNTRGRTKAGTPAPICAATRLTPQTGKRKASGRDSESRHWRASGRAEAVGRTPSTGPRTSQKTMTRTIGPGSGQVEALQVSDPLTAMYRDEMDTSDKSKAEARMRARKKAATPTRKGLGR